MLERGLQCSLRDATKAGSMKKARPQLQTRRQQKRHQQRLLCLRSEAEAGPGRVLALPPHLLVITLPI